MISFYPGPAKLYPQVRNYLTEAFDSQILEKNHRSNFFENLFQETCTLLKQKLQIPDGFVISFVSSATESWEIIAQSFTKEESVHLVNGAFGKKWYDYAKKNHQSCKLIEYSIEESVLTRNKNFDTELIAITQNDTSNGTQVSNDELRTIKKLNPNTLIAIDATSSLAGVFLDFTNIDICFASVQKCFGLPSGMAVMICSQRAIEQAKKINDTNFYNSYLKQLSNSLKNQTSHTPNILNIYLMNCLMKDISPISEINKKIISQSEAWYSYFESHSSFSLLVQNKEVRSNTVICVQTELDLKTLFKDTENKGFLIGKGYGNWKDNCFRIANFPAINEMEIKKLKDFLNTK